jgi:hypothetical protein
MGLMELSREAADSPVNVNSTCPESGESEELRHTTEKGREKGFSKRFGMGKQSLRLDQTAVARREKKDAGSGCSSVLLSV